MHAKLDRTLTFITFHFPYLSETNLMAKLWSKMYRKLYS